METIVLSPSMAAAVRTCTRQALLRTAGLGMGTEPKRAKAGKAFHRAHEQWIRGAETASCLSAFNTEYERYSDEYITADDTYHKGNLRNILRVYLQRNPLQTQPFRMIEAEQQIAVREEWSKDLDIVLTDILDSIIQMHDTGLYWSYELKTTGSYNLDEYVRDYFLRGQIISHVYTAQKHGIPVVGCVLSVIRINKLPELGRTTKAGKPYKCREHKIPYEECWAGHVQFNRYQIQPTAEQIEKWHTDCTYTAGDYYDKINTYTTDSAPMEGVLNGSCGRCDFQDYCLNPDPARLTKRERDPKIRPSGLELEPVAEIGVAT